MIIHPIGSISFSLENLTLVTHIGGREAMLGDSEHSSCTDRGAKVSDPVIAMTTSKC